MKESFASRVLKRLREDGGEMESVVLARELEIPYGDNVQNRRFYGVLRDLRRACKIERVRQGVYRAIRPMGKPAPFPIAEVMWRVLRAKKTGITVEDLVEMSGAKEAYAREWLGALMRQGVVAKTGERYRLIKDTVEMPVDEKKAERLRALRARVKAKIAEARKVLDEIEGAYAAIAETENGE